ncbi:MAG TPA: 3-phosphoshikimate 1-carboxyvinyltransferase [Candidatus Eisenbacteria bacterium]|nr:3-phosphoshikimate 1-carboxyvinyltransferase [Candidatus Eisenbacteria bacterium]
MSRASRATVRPGRALRGEVFLPGDKSITQRGILLGALAPGLTRIRGANPGADARAALGIARSLGASVRRIGRGSGKGADRPELLLRGGRIEEPDRILDARNSGTALRLSIGLLAAQPFLSILTGDNSLKRRPVDRVLEPLRLLGADLSARANDRLPPVVVRGKPLRGAEVETGVASAQVKSALLLAAIQAEGTTTVREAAATRDHTERMLPLFGVPVARDGNAVRVSGGSPLHGAEVDVPGDASAAAFLAVAAALVPRSDLLFRGVGVNPARRALFDLLSRAGADVSFHDERAAGEEPVADVRIRHATLRPVDVSAAEVPALIDELPLVAVLGAFARGITTVRGARELRVKESDRIAAVVTALRAIGGRVEELEDGWAVTGTGRLAGGRVESGGDHRIAMAFLVAGLRAAEGVTVEGAEAAVVSDPDFLSRLRGLAR